MWLENDNKSCIKHVKPDLWHKYKGLSQEKIANTDLKGCNKKQKDKKAQNLAHSTPPPPEKTSQSKMFRRVMSFGAKHLEFVFIESDLWFA